MHREFKWLAERHRWGKVSSYVSDIRLSGGDGFLDLEVVLPAASLQQQENVKTGQKGHLHKDPLFAVLLIPGKGDSQLCHGCFITSICLSSRALGCLWYPVISHQVFLSCLPFCLPQLLVIAVVNVFQREECKAGSHSLAQSPLDNYLDNLST